MARRKTPEEIACMEEAQRAAESALTAVLDYLRRADEPTAEGAHKIIDETLASLGCDSPEGHIVAGGEQAVEPHERGHGIILPHQAIVIDIFPRSKRSGYFADMTRTVCIGKPSPELQKMYDAVVEAQDVAFALIRPGAETKSLQEAVEKHFIDNGYQTSGKGKEFTFAEGFVHGLGHGVGTEVHEKPHIGRKPGEFLEEGDVITIEPGLYYPGLGGVRMEDMVLVTRAGYRNLTKSEKRFAY